MEWIKLTDRLPEDKTAVFFATAKRGVKIGTFLSLDSFSRPNIFCAVDGGHFSGEYSDYGMNVTHWMPFILPPNPNI